MRRHKQEPELWGPGGAQRRRRVNTEQGAVQGGCELQTDGQRGWLDQSYFCPCHFIFFTTNEDLASHMRPDTPGPQVLLQLWWVFAAPFRQGVSKHPCAEGRTISPFCPSQCSSEPGYFPDMVLSTAQVVKALTTLATAPLDTKVMQKTIQDQMLLVELNKFFFQ